MSSAITFKGSYRYASKSALRLAIDEAQEMLEGEDEDFPDPFVDGIKSKGTEVVIDINTSAPSDWFFTYESIIEVLAEHAASGMVEATIEGADGSESYPAGGGGKA